jgi:hypothetical protein
MDRAIPEYNKLLARREYKINKHIHKVHLYNASKAIDNSLPISLSHPINRRAKEA